MLLPEFRLKDKPVSPSGHSHPQMKVYFNYLKFKRNIQKITEKANISSLPLPGYD